MFVATIIVSVLLAVALFSSARLWLSRDPRILAIVEHTQLPASSPPYLAGIKIAGAVGVLVGLAVSWQGVAAAAGVVVYFIVAAIAHLRVGDYKEVYAPAIPLVLVIAAPGPRLVTI